MPKVEYPEPMARFQCNLQGCCCRGWTIPFRPPDLRRLIEQMEDEELNETLRGAVFHSGTEGRLDGFELRAEPPDRRCQFLATEGKCGLQVQRGEEILPTICRAYPGSAFEQGDLYEMVWDVACPEVLERLDESDEPLEIVTRDLADDHALVQRSKLTLVRPALKLGNTEMDVEAFDLIRRRLCAAFQAPRGSVLETLSAANWALWRIAQGEEAASFELRDDPIEPFLRYFEACVWVHRPQLLSEKLKTYERFIFAVDLSGADWSELDHHLGLSEDWRSTLDPDAPEVAPLLFRYLTHRAYAPFGVSFATSHVDLVFGALTHYVTTALRMALGLMGWLKLDDGRTALKVALGASEYLYRGVRDLPTSVMPWFDAEAW